MRYGLLALIFLLGSSVASAQVDYQNLAPIPQLLKEGSSDTSNIQSFLEGILPLVIGLAGGLAVIYIIIGGVQYLSTDAWNGKKEGKKTIQNAITGLLLAIAAFSILYTVNPKLVEFDLLIQSVGTTTPLSSGNGITKKSAAETGCNNDCVAVDPNNVPIKPYGYACSNDPCYINSALEEKLRDLKEVMANQSIAWQVTEAFPPTVPHSDPCHKPSTAESGKCVDAALISPSTANVVKFMRSILAQGLKFEYERCGTEPKVNPLLKDPVFSETGENKDLRQYLKCETTTTAQHAHIEI
jgi:hypothetical protein